MAFRKVYMTVLMFAMMFLLSENVSAMTFSQPVQIGKLSAPPMGYFEIEEYDYHKGTPCTIPEYKHLKLYEKGLARFGTGTDALYFHYDVNQKIPVPNTKYAVGLSKFGDKDIKNAVQANVGIPTIIWLLKTDSKMTFYLLEHGDPSGMVGTTRTLIGRKKDGTFVKYFSTYEIKKNYLGNPTHKDNKIEQSNKIFFEENTIIVPYYLWTNLEGTYQNVPKGEFRFKWDDAAQWFGVEHVVY